MTGVQTCALPICFPVTIDGNGGITEITSIDVTANDGKLTMDALNLQQKVYNMLNRIAVSGGTYRDWLETVYTAESIVTGKQRYLSVA